MTRLIAIAVLFVSVSLVTSANDTQDVINDTQDDWSVRGTLPPFTIGRHDTFQDFLSPDDVATINRDHQARRNGARTFFGSNGVSRTIERESMDNDQQQRQQPEGPLLPPRTGREGIDGTRTFFGSNDVFRTTERGPVDNDRQHRQQPVRPILRPETGREGINGTRTFFGSNEVFRTIERGSADNDRQHRQQPERPLLPPGTGRVGIDGTRTFFGSNDVFRTTEREFVDNDRQHRQQPVRPILRPETGREGIPRSGPRPWDFSQSSTTRGAKIPSTTAFPSFRSGQTQGLKTRTGFSSRRGQRQEQPNQRNLSHRDVKPHCLLPMTSGRCLAYKLRFAYNPQTRKCQPFVYGGCQGNDNNFLSSDDCIKDCAAEGVETFQF